MGDSDITSYMSVAALFVMVGAIVAFVIAWRVRRRVVRVCVGVILVAVSAVCGILSLFAALLVATLGVAALVLAGKTPRSASLGAKEESERFR